MSRSPRDRTRAIAWGILLVLGALQAWATRFAVSPDGMSYLDLSDAVVSGHWSELLNPYWSPLYPATLGLVRLAFRPDVYWEFATFHVANLLFFIVTIVAFEYFLSALRTHAEGWGRHELSTPRGVALTYAFFGALTLVMTPLSLTTPDLAVSASVYATLGALVRLQRDGASRRASIVLGVALAMGSVTKTFMLPWSVVCLAVALISRCRHGRWRVVVTSVMTWGAVAMLWTVALSMHVGRFTYGDTGKLTYTWYVNMKGSPTSNEMPPATRDATLEALLPGVGVMHAGTGSNPMWYDPARWYAGLTADRDLVQQFKVVRFLASDLSVSLAPLVFLLALTIAVADPKPRRDAIARAWIVVAPALIAIAAYTLILVATRYIVAFVVAMTLAIWMAFDWPRRLRPTSVGLALAFAVLSMWSSLQAPAAFGLEAAVLVALMIGSAASSLSLSMRVLLAIVGGVLTRVLMPVAIPAAARGGVVLVALAFVALVAVVKEANRERFSFTVRRWLLVSTSVVLAWISVRKYSETIASLYTPSRFPDANATWAVAERLKSAGLEPGMRIGIIGSSFDTYWARTLRAQIVAVVPPARASAFWALAEDKREALVAAFAASGVDALVVGAVPTELTRDPRWLSLYRNGSVRILRAPSSRSKP